MQREKRGIGMKREMLDERRYHRRGGEGRDAGREDKEEEKELVRRFKKGREEKGKK